MIDVRHFYKFSTSTARPTIPYTSEFTGSYGYFEYELSIGRLLYVLYDVPYVAASMRTFKVAPVS